MIFTIGFTQKTAEKFFNLLTENKIDLLIDIRLNNTSQLAGFAKFPDIQFLLKNYKKKKVSWGEYEIVFEKIMSERNIFQYIQEQYAEYSDLNICLLCSEASEKQCHRRLVAEYFQNAFKAKVTHL